MTAAARRQIQSVQTARKMRIRPCDRGWNARDPISAQKPGDAYQLDNWICRAGYTEIRKGYAEHVVGFTDAVESFLPYRTGATEELYAASGDSIYDVTSAGSLGSAVVSSLTNARWQSVNIANDAGIYMMSVNGDDDPLLYDGSSWTNPTITGSSGSATLAKSTLIDVMLHKRRLFFAEKNSLRVWYLPVDSITGSCGLLDLGPVFSEGGSLTGMGVWSPEGGVQNVQSVAAFVTDQGQVAIYVGDDPDSADTWALEGVYAIGKPLGRRCVMKSGADLLIVTYDGAVPLSVVRTSKLEDQRNRAITSRIQNAFAMASAAYGSKFGWQSILYPTGQLVIINVPVTELGTAKQFVQSTQTGGWSQFNGINAVCWAYVNDQIFFGGIDGSSQKGVYRWDTGGSDNGTSIQCDLITSFEEFSTPDLKNFTMLRPILRASNGVNPYVDMLVDYKITAPTNVPDSEPTSTAGIWDVSLWDVARWGSANPLRLDWTGATGIGYVGAARMRVIANPQASEAGVYPTIQCQIIGFDGLFTPGSAL